MASHFCDQWLSVKGDHVILRSNFILRSNLSFPRAFIGNPFSCLTSSPPWIPACAGMTEGGRRDDAGVWDDAGVLLDARCHSAGDSWIT